MDTVLDEADHEAGTAARFRRVLGLLPRRYRLRRGEEMLAVMLDMAQDEGRERPSLGETLSVIALSLRLRAGAPGSSPRARSVGAAMRLITLLGLVLQVAVQAQSLAVGLSAATVDNGAEFGLVGVGHAAAFVAVSGLLFPPLALAALLGGRRRTATLLAASPVVLLAQIPNAFGGNLGLPSMFGHVFSTFLLCAIPAVAASLGFQIEAPGPQCPRRWFAAMASAAAVFLVVGYANARPLGSGWAVSSNVLAVACACLAVGTAIARARHSTVWPAALMVVGAPLLFMIPYTFSSLTYTAGVPWLSTLSFPGSMYSYVGGYALVAEMMLCLVVAATSLRRLRSTAVSAHS